MTGDLKLCLKVLKIHLGSSSHWDGSSGRTISLGLEGAKDEVEEAIEDVLGALTVGGGALSLPVRACACRIFGCLGQGVDFRVACLCLDGVLGRVSGEETTLVGSMLVLGVLDDILVISISQLVEI